MWILLVSFQNPISDDSSLGWVLLCSIYCLPHRTPVHYASCLTISLGTSASTSLRQCVDWAWTDTCLVSTLLPRGWTWTHCPGCSRTRYNKGVLLMWYSWVVRTSLCTDFTTNLIHLYLTPSLPPPTPPLSLPLPLLPSFFHPPPPSFPPQAFNFSFQLSTSQTPVRTTDRWSLERSTQGGGFGTVTDNGYGVSYIVIGEDQGEQLLKVVSYRLCV